MTEFLATYDTQSNELTIAEVAKILRCTNAMVYKLCTQCQELTYYKVGTRYWIPKETVRDYILQNRGGKK